ncbi:hypothetical protein CMI37_30955 [Candidatus Pacearchaeota archaeon]|nr:hypothetical protein [Candidatus Pacearchaeota archaeon]|tara:strand:- start:191 stop:1108 length:918 start_codon:yes stop_codon:yes gene_type:complete
MAFTLIEYAKTTQDPIQSAVVEEFAKSSVVLEMLPFKEIVGGSYTYNKEERLPGIAFRGINESYSESTGLVNPQTEALKIMGGDADTDKALLKREKDFGARRASDLVMKAKAAALYFTKIFFDGDEATESKQFDGLNQRLTGNQLITAGANGANLDLNLLDQVIDAVVGKPDVLLMGKAMRRQVKSLLTGSSLVQVSQDEWGRQVEAYDGIRIGIVEKDNDDSEILDFDETKGSETEAGSLYAVRFGVDTHLCGIQIEPLEAYDIGELETKPAFRSRIEWQMSIAIFHSRSAARLDGISKISGVA